MRKLILRLALMFGVLAILMGLSEIVLRSKGYGALPSVWFDPEVGTRFHPSQTREIFAVGERFMHKASINSLGLRGHEPLPEADGDAGLRVICLGDSFVFGWGVEDDETLPVVLESLLERDAGGPVDVINGGLPGYNTWQEHQLYKKVMADLDPDVVVVAWYMNDLDPMSYGTTGTLAPKDHPLAGTALLDYWARKVRNRIFGNPKFEFEGFDQPKALELKKVYDQKRDLIWAESGHPDARPFVERNLQDLNDLLDTIEGQGAKPVLLVFPTVGQMDQLKKARAELSPEEYAAARTKRAHIQTELVAFAAGRGIPALDVLDLYMDSEVRPYGEIDLSHPSATGQRIAAEALAETLKEAGLVH